MHGPYRIQGAQWWLRDTADLEATRAQIERAQSALRSDNLVDRKSGRRKGLFDLCLAGSVGSEASLPADHLLKRNTYTGLARLRRGIRGSKARVELMRAEEAASRGIPTPIPLAAGEVVRAGLLDHCLLLMPILEGATDLRARWEGDPLAPAERRELAAAFGRFTQQLVEAGLFQDDFAPNNVLIRPGTPPQLWAIDFERAELRQKVSPSETARMLAKLQREMVGTNRGDEIRFLQSFAGRDASLWTRRVSAEAPKLLARDLAHLERTLRRTGRRFAPQRDGAFHGWVRKEVPLSALKRSRDASGSPDGRRELPPLPASTGRRIFATATLLARRGLGPRPDALWTSRDRTCLLYDPATCTPGSPTSPAARALLRRLLGLARLEGGPRPGDLGLASRTTNRSIATWLAPERVQISGVASPREELLSALEAIH
ncbi:MAG: hypothetical protein GY723_01650 [bacterium]|nr:hypothetical protein [bacterium]